MVVLRYLTKAFVCDRLPEQLNSFKWTENAASRRVGVADVVGSCMAYGNVLFKMGRVGQAVAFGRRVKVMKTGRLGTGKSACVSLAYTGAHVCCYAEMWQPLIEASVWREVKPERRDFSKYTFIDFLEVS